MEKRTDGTEKMPDGLAVARAYRPSGFLHPEAVD